MKVERPSTLEDAVVAYHEGSWFKWTDIYNKTYANLRLHEKVWNSDATELIDNPITELPTEEELNVKLAELQISYDKLILSYKTDRIENFTQVKEQLKIFHTEIESLKAEVAALKSS